jgi:serine/threonine protein kinase
MELASRRTLRAMLAPFEGEAPSWECRVAAARAIIDGVAAIHAARLVHGDLKPENILLMDGDRLVIADFNVSVELDGSASRSVPGGGTLFYLAPERLRGGQSTSPSSSSSATVCTTYPRDAQRMAASCGRLSIRQSAVTVLGCDGVSAGGCPSPAHCCSRPCR